MQKQPLFTLEERLALLRATIGKLDNVEIAPLDGLLVDFAVPREATRSHPRLARRLRFRVRIPDGADESQAGGKSGNNLPDAKGGIHLSQLPHRKRDRAARRQTLPNLCRPRSQRRSEPNSVNDEARMSNVETNPNARMTKRCSPSVFSPLGLGESFVIGPASFVISQ